jgi:VRR-NUC domain.
MAETKPRSAKAGMSEDDLLRNVIILCKFFRLRTAHFRPGQTRSGRWVTPVQGDGKGFPDLVIAGPGGLLFRELKTEKGRLTPDQQAWQAVLASAGADVAVWRPRDWPDLIRRELEKLRIPKARVEVVR